MPCREVQKKELAFCLSPAEKERKPFDCLCHGKPGTGKTALVKYVLRQLSESTDAFAFYVNCWENRTLNQVLDELLRQAQLPIVEASHSVKLSGLKKKIGSKACVIALDEIDKLDRKELNDILYLLKEVGRVGLICISNTRKYLLNLDPRVDSRLSFNSINFPPYSNEELMAILKHRIVDCKALYPNTWSKEVLERITDLACGE
ncbi:MAG: AAA family ATPase [Thermoproteota archaeon]